MCRNSSNWTNDRPGLDASVNFFTAYQDRLPTKHEDAIDYPKLFLILECVSKEAEKLGIQLPEAISIGTVCSGNLNAHVLQVADGQPAHLLVFNRQLFLFCDLFSRYIARLIANEVEEHPGNLTLRTREPTKLEMQDLDAVVYYLINSIAFYRDDGGGIELIVAIDKTNAQMPVLETDEVGTCFKEMMLVPMVAFVVAHELMHVHVKHAKSTGLPLDIRTPFEEELLCDTQGVVIAAQTATTLCKNVYPQGWQKFGAVASLLFLSCLDITQKAAYVLHNGTLPPRTMEDVDIEALENNQLDTYPTTLLRLQIAYAKLREDISRLLAPNPADWVFENSGWIDTFFVEAWKEMKGYYLNRHAARSQALNIFRSLRKSP